MNRHRLDQRKHNGVTRSQPEKRKVGGSIPPLATSGAIAATPLFAIRRFSTDMPTFWSKIAATSACIRPRDMYTSCVIDGLAWPS